ncbi:5-methylthioribose kinase, partial [Cronobacter sakazakii]
GKKRMIRSSLPPAMVFARAFIFLPPRVETAEEFIARVRQ